MWTVSANDVGWFNFRFSPLSLYVRFAPTTGAWWRVSSLISIYLSHSWIWAPPPPRRQGDRKRIPSLAFSLLAWLQLWSADPSLPIPPPRSNTPSCCYAVWGSRENTRDTQTPHISPVVWQWPNFFPVRLHCRDKTWIDHYRLTGVLMQLMVIEVDSLCEDFA